MTIDISTIKPGGRVSVTLADGTKVIDSPVTCVPGDGYWIAYDLIRLTFHSGRKADGLIASIDAYTPPAPEWDRPEVYAVRTLGGVEYHRAGDGWLGSRGLVRADYVDSFGPCTVLAVYAEGVRS